MISKKALLKELEKMWEKADENCFGMAAGFDEGHGVGELQGIEAVMDMINTLPPPTFAKEVLEEIESTLTTYRHFRAYIEYNPVYKVSVEDFIKYEVYREVINELLGLQVRIEGMIKDD